MSDPSFQPLAFGVCAGITVGMQLLFFAIAFTYKFDKVTDLAGCTNFVILAFVVCVWKYENVTPRQIVATSLVVASRLQLAVYLCYRVCKRGRDSRFDEMRSKCLQFLGFWILQMLWVYVVSAAIIYIDSTFVTPDPPLGGWDFAGWALFGAGFLLQVAADYQKNAFRSDPVNSKKVCSLGVWRYSRHPNFCGEILMWWAVYLMGVPLFTASPAGFATVVSPLFTMLLLLVVSGIPFAEGQFSARWYDGADSEREYVAYFESTPPLWLCPPRLYGPLPLLVKRTLCFELPSYRYVRKSSSGRARGDSGASTPPDELNVVVGIGDS